ncbi:hypothetical protein [Cupriavidus sp. IDO]|uniref:hypothetical protein n=1 Tax=Cupriavidus sp. IDO TaxID=1539142 RepID=UPI00126A3B03|nr:hypothetical protein [Cupriavidus sp. IDO]
MQGLKLTMVRPVLRHQGALFVWFFADLWGWVADVPDGGGCGLTLSKVDGPGFALKGESLSVRATESNQRTLFLPAGRESYRSLPAFLYGYGLQGIATMPAAW